MISTITFRGIVFFGADGVSSVFGCSSAFGSSVFCGAGAAAGAGVESFSFGTPPETEVPDAGMFSFGAFPGMLSFGTGAEVEF